MKEETRYNARMVTAAEAIDRIRNGSRVFIGSGCGEPRHLIHAMVKSRRVHDIMIFQMLGFTLARYLKEPDFQDRFSVRLFFVGTQMQQPAFEGKFDYIPTCLSRMPNLFRSCQIGIDVALVQISPPDRFGVASLGVSVDVTLEAVKNARLIIAQVNPRMPRTHGDGFIHVDEIDCLVPFEEELLEDTEETPDAALTGRIATYIKELVDDGATLQIGYGPLPYALLAHMEDKNDLGIHTHMISKHFIPLFEKGVITNRRKNFMKNRAVATFCMGDRATYDYIDHNILFYFGTADFVNTPGIVGRNNHFVSISSALEVDLTGQVCSDSAGRQFFSGTGDQSNFIRGATLSKGGFSIIALPSTAQNGSVSRIVATLGAGAGVATLRTDVDFVVTEYGIAQLTGKSIYQRVIELIQIAHPRFREALLEAAKASHYIFADQMPLPAEDLTFLEAYKSRFTLKNGKTMTVRPLLPSDEIAYRNFFYALKEETVFMRFFHSITVFSRKMAQDHWANMDYRNNISLIGMVRNRGNNEMMAIATYAQAEKGRAEVAFVVREDYQGLGIAKYLLKELETVARANDYVGFEATVLSKNKAMIHIFTARFPQAEIDYGVPGEITIRMPFAPLAQ